MNVDCILEDSGYINKLFQFNKEILKEDSEINKQNIDLKIL